MERRKYFDVAGNGLGIKCVICFIHFIPFTRGNGIGTNNLTGRCGTKGRMEYL